MKIYRRVKRSIMWNRIIILIIIIVITVLGISIAKNKSKNKTKNIFYTSKSSSSISASEPITSTSNTKTSDIPVGGDNVDTNNSSVQSIKLSIYEVTLKIGETQMPIVTMLPETAPDKSEVWSSSNPNIAIVDDIGNIKAMGNGTCTITVKSAANPGVKADINVTVNSETQNSTSNSESSKTASGVTYIKDILIVNKTYGLPADYNPGENSETQEKFDTMKQAAAAEGLDIWIASFFRLYETQERIYNNYVASDGKDNADTYSARPGYSEHQTGLAFDLNSIDDSFADTAEGKWVAENCYKYGFIIRYPKDKEAITGYKYEPWHLRYLGVDVATKVHNSGLTLEEYLGITSQYPN